MSSSSELPKSVAATATEPAALTPPERGTSATGPTPITAIVVPHTHWDREWYAPFETMRFHLVQMLDELVDTLEREPDLPTFLLDGQVVILEDYLEVRRSQRERVGTLVTAGRLQPGPFYVQPDEFHVSGEALVRNLLIGIATAAEFGGVLREGYLPDTFGHVHQLPQILRGFGIATFYAMRGFGADPDDTGGQFWWAAPDGSRVRVEWLTESYSNAAVLTGDPATMALHHGVLVGYDSLPELLERLGNRAASGVLLLLNGGDHLRVQADLPHLVRRLDTGLTADDRLADVRLGGLADFAALVAARPAPQNVVRGEFRYGARHDVFDGISSTRTPLKALNEATEAHLTGVAERLDALATVLDGRSAADALHYAWRELLKNYAHDSICGCSVDIVVTEMEVRFAKVGQVATAVAEDALARVAVATAPPRPADGIGVAVVNPSAFRRTGPVDVDVIFDLTTPVGRRQFGWTQQPGGDAADYTLIGPDGDAVPFSVAAATEVVVADALNRRKELLRDRISFVASDVPPLGVAAYRLVPATPDRSSPSTPAGSARGERWLENAVLRVEVTPDGRLAVTDRATGRRFDGLLELLDDGDAGDEYGFGPLPGDQPRSPGQHTVGLGSDPDSLVLRTTLTLPAALTADRSGRAAELVDLPLAVTVRLGPDADRVDVTITMDNTARDHRLRLRFPTGTGAAAALAESAYGTVRRDRALPDSTGWQETPSGAFALRRFVAMEDDPLAETPAGLQILTEGLHEYFCPADGVVDVTLLRAVGWLARLDHPSRPHKVGPQVRAPGAQCLGPHTFRLAIRPYAVPAGPGPLYRAAEEFSVPLQGWAVQTQIGEGRTAAMQQTHDRTDLDGASSAPASPLGLAVEPAEVVVTAVKTAEDGQGIVVRAFNSADRPVTAALGARFALSAASRCDLEETPAESLAVGADGVVTLPLAAGQIATVRLQTSPPLSSGGHT